MKSSLALSSLCLFFFSVACSSPKGPSDLLIQANEIHLEASKKYDQVHDRYDVLKKDAVERQDSLAIARLDSVHEVLHIWKEGLYEVPGFEHAHSHGDGAHDHNHTVAPSMTDQSMLDYQKNAKEAIDEIMEFLERNFN
jgi:hypothetical protein